MKIIARDILESFVRTGLKPTWGTFGNGKESGCAVTAYALDHFGRVKGVECGDPDHGALKIKIGSGRYYTLIRGYESGTKFARQRVTPSQLEYEDFRTGFEAARRLADADGDARLALMEMDIEEVKEEATLTQATA